MKNKNLIVWEKWASPFADDTEFDYDPDADDRLDDEFEGEPLDGPHPVGKKHRVLISDHGVIPLVGPRALMDIMNFWQGHTSFNISYPICEIVSETLGVESFEVMSPLRMRIAVGKLFKPSEVFSSISKQVDEHFKNLETKPYQQKRSRKRITDLLSAQDPSSVPWLLDETTKETDGVKNGNT